MDPGSNVLGGTQLTPGGMWCRAPIGTTGHGDDYFAVMSLTASCSILHALQSGDKNIGRAETLSVEQHDHALVVAVDVRVFQAREGHEVPIAELTVGQLPLGLECLRECLDGLALLGGPLRGIGAIHEVVFGEVVLLVGTVQTVSGGREDARRISRGGDRNTAGEARRVLRRCCPERLRSTLWCRETWASIV